MKITSSALSLTVAEVGVSSKFLREQFGFEEKFNADGFAYLTHPDAGMDIVLLRIGMEVLPDKLQHQQAAGIIVAFVVEDVEAEEKRLKRNGVTISLPLQEDPWGERLFQVEDANGITYQVVQWVKAADEKYSYNPGSPN